MSTLNYRRFGRWVCLLAIVAVFLGSATQTLASGPSSLVLYLPMHEGEGNVAHDLSGFGNDGDITGATWTADGLSGNALSFDGSGDYIKCSDDPTLNPGTGSWTVEAWFKTSTEARQGLLVKDDGTDGYYLDIYDYRELHFLVRDSGSYDKIVGTTRDLHDGQWHQAVGVRDESDGKLYLYLDGAPDAAPVEAVNTAGGDVAPSVDCYLGNLGSTGSFQFRGTMDEVRVYSRALSASEILQRYEDAMSAFGGQDAPEEPAAVSGLTIWGSAAAAVALLIAAPLLLRRRAPARSIIRRRQ